MCDALAWFFGALTSINWLDLIKTLASVATAVVAFWALKNWLRQDKAKREAEFLDALLEATHTYIAEMSTPITRLEIVRIGMASYAPTWKNGEDADVNGAIAYIEKNGEREGKCLLEILKATQPSVIKLRFLAVKGQMFKFDDYAKCQNAVAVLTSCFDNIEAVMACIATPTSNWEHPEVLESLKSIMAINPNRIRKSIEDNSTTLLEFAAETYKQIYR